MHDASDLPAPIPDVTAAPNQAAQNQFAPSYLVPPDPAVPAPAFVPQTANAGYPATPPVWVDTHRERVLKTLREGAVMFLLSVIVGGVLQALGAKFLLPSPEQMKGMGQLAKANPFVIALLVVVVAPVCEESLFRGVPWLLWRGLSFKATRESRMRASWVLGVPAALLFSAMHGVDAHQHFSTLPVPQLLLGLWSWRVLTTRGLRYSMLLHATHNSIPLLFLLFLRLSGSPLPTH